MAMDYVVPRRGLSRRRHSCFFINGLDRTYRVAVYHRCDPPSSRLSRSRTFNNERSTIQFESEFGTQNQRSRR
jgi:hypothetical protein